MKNAKSLVVIAAVVLVAVLAVGTFLVISGNGSAPAGSSSTDVPGAVEDKSGPSPESVETWDDEGAESAEGASGSEGEKPADGSAGNPGNEGGKGSSGGEGSGGGGSSKELTEYEKYELMTPEEQQAYYESFDSPEDFFAWYNAAREAYEEANRGVDVEGETIDLGKYL